MFSNYSVRKPFTVVVAVIIIAILGAVSVMNMSTDLFPSINLPYTVVITNYVGASPEEVEMVVTKPIEQRMSSVSNIKNVSSVSQENMSIVILEFTQSANMDSVIIEMRESLDLIKAYMPDSVGIPMIMKLNPDMMPVMVVSAAVKGQEISQSSSFIENRIIPELESVEGIASVTSTGLVENGIHVTLRDDKIDEVNIKMQQAMMSAAANQNQAPAELPLTNQTESSQQLSITKEMVSGILKGQNFSMPAGYISEDGVNYLVRTGDKINDLEELESLVVMTLPIPGLEPVRLKDIAEINVVNNSGDMYSKVNANDAAILVIQKQTEFTTSDVAKELRGKIESVMSSNEGVEVVPLMDQGKYIDVVVNSISQNLIFGGILAVLILLLFLRDFKPTIIVGFAIPVSLISAFVLMYFSKITLNIISMGGLALGVGMLVDTSFVVIEYIYIMRYVGKSAIKAAVEGAQQVAGAIMASTLTTIAVFVPILFTQGFTRQIFSDMGLTIAFSLLASLVIALTFVPMMASKLLVKDTVKEHNVLESMKSRYTRVLNFSLKHKWIVFLIVSVLFAGSIVSALRMGTELFPASDSGQLSVDMTMPKGTSFDETTAQADELMDIISSIEGVDTVGASMGGGMFRMGGGMGGGSSTDSVSFNILLDDSRKKSTEDITQIIRDKTESTEYEISVSNSGVDMTSMSGGKIVVDIRGRDFDTLQEISKQVASIVSSVEGTIDISDGIEETSPELRIVVDKSKSIAKGLTVAQVFMEVNKLLANSTSDTTISMGNTDYDIYVMNEYDRESISREDLKDMSIASPQGETVKLTDISDIIEAAGFTSINRSNQQRYVTVGAELSQGYNIGHVSDEINKKLLDLDIPEGYSVEMGGENEMIVDSFKDLFLMLALAVVFIYLIMVAQFQSLLSPFIVMFTIPLAFTGGFLGLLVTGKPLSIVAFVGLIVLSGVVVNNGIVFVDYMNKMRESGLSKKEAIIKAGNDRMRPIMMTALTTIFALSTMSFGAGTGTEMMQPMAITAIGGLIYATLLTLILIPVLYDSFNRKK